MDFAISKITDLEKFMTPHFQRGSEVSLLTLFQCNEFILYTTLYVIIYTAHCQVQPILLPFLFITYILCQEFYLPIEHYFNKQVKFELIEIILGKYIIETESLINKRSEPLTLKSGKLHTNLKFIRK